MPIGDPPGPYQSDYLLAQTVHERPIVGGYISRVRVDPFIEGSPGVREFRYLGGPPDIVAQAPGSDTTVPPLASAARALLQHNNIRTIIVHTDQLTSTQTLSATTTLAAQISGSPPVYTDATLRAYAVTGTPDPAQVVLQLGAGWSAAGIETGESHGRAVGGPEGRDPDHGLCAPYLAVERCRRRGFRGAIGADAAGSRGAGGLWALPAQPVV